jgi:hypothetical protein
LRFTGDQCCRNFPPHASRQAALHQVRRTPPRLPTPYPVRRTLRPVTYHHHARPTMPPHASRIAVAPSAGIRDRTSEREY